MWCWEEYLQRHNLTINPSDYGFETESEIAESENHVRVVRSAVNTNSLWKFFVRHHGLDTFPSLEYLRNNSSNCLSREQELIFQAFPYLSSIWNLWQENSGDYARLSYSI